MQALNFQLLETFVEAIGLGTQYMESTAMRHAIIAGETSTDASESDWCSLN